MAYTNKTQFFGIPVMGAGDLLTEEQETEQMGILDSLLYALAYGCKTLIVEEGNYSIIDGKLTITPAIQQISSTRVFAEGNSNSTSTSVSQSESFSESQEEEQEQEEDFSRNSYSLMGIVNGRMFASRQSIVVDRVLYDGNTYYAYVEYTSALNKNTALFDVAIYDEEQDANDIRLPLCKIQSVGTSAWSIDTNISGKLYSANIVSHSATATNPHGSTLVQSTLQVSNALSLKGNSVAGAIYGNYITSGSTSVSIPIETSGSVVFVTCYPENTSAGTIAWAISNNTITFTNSGASGITVNYKVDVL